MMLLFYGNDCLFSLVKTFFNNLNTSCASKGSIKALNEAINVSRKIGNNADSVLTIGYPNFFYTIQCK